MPAFVKPVPIAPTSIGRIIVELWDNPQMVDPITGETIQAIKSASYNVVIYDQYGRRMDVTGDKGDLVPYLSQTDVTWLLSFMARLRTKAETEFLGAAP